MEYWAQLDQEDSNMSINTNIVPEFLTKTITESIDKPGILHASYYEEMPTFEKAGCEFAYPDVQYVSGAGKSDGGKNRLNCQIVFGRDRPSHLLSGYGKVGGQPCASIDIVAGRMSSSNKKNGLFQKTLEPVTRGTLVGNNFFADASRIYISQKCDIDHYFGLPPGDFGRPKAEAGIGIKSDHVRVIGRNSVKIYAGAARAENLSSMGELDSNGEKLVDSRIEFITNTDKEPQPIVLGQNLMEFLDDLMDRLSSIEEAFALQNLSIASLSRAIAMHSHIGGGIGFVAVGPDPFLAASCVKNIIMNSQKARNHLSRALNFKIMKMNYLGVPNSEDGRYRLKGKKNILSRNVFTT